MQQSIQLEVLVDSVESARAAKRGGADRLEVCQNLFEGGTTPSAGLIAAIRGAVDLPMNVMIRPRGGDFCYTADEIGVMRKDIVTARELGANGVVLGLLAPDGTVDCEPTRQLVTLARPMSITFHRAIDMTRNLSEALETIIGLGIDRILTSGGEATVLEGLDTITALIRQAGDRIVVMPGGGIREHNLPRILASCRPLEIHVSGNRNIDSRMQYRNTRVPMGRELRAPEFLMSQVDPDRIGRYRLMVSGQEG